MLDIDELLKVLHEREGSDLHLKVGSPPLMRVQGVLSQVEDREPLTAQDTQEVLQAIVPAHRKDHFEEKGEADFAYSLPGVARFRVNAFRQRGSISLVMRLVRIGAPSIKDLGLPAVVEDLADIPRGLVLVTGPTGSGKSTTLAAVIDRINATRPCHIVTIEDPIEFLHRDQQAAVNQREVGVDVLTFAEAMRSAMRQDPDVILIGEMRDTETVRAALAAAETGHLVLSTLHTIDATETVNRIVDFFPPYQQQQIRVTLAGALRVILCQRLVASADGGRVPAVEVCVNTGRVAERILDPTRTGEIQEVVREGDFYGMQTFDQSLLELVKSGSVGAADAVEASSNRHDFELMLQQAGITLSV